MGREFVPYGLSTEGESAAIEVVESTAEDSLEDVASEGQDAGIEEASTRGTESIKPVEAVKLIEADTLVESESADITEVANASTPTGSEPVATSRGESTTIRETGGRAHSLGNGSSKLRNSRSLLAGAWSHGSSSELVTISELRGESSNLGNDLRDYLRNNHNLLMLEVVKAVEPAEVTVIKVIESECSSTDTTGARRADSCILGKADAGNKHSTGEGENTSHGILLTRGHRSWQFTRPTPVVPLDSTHQTLAGVVFALGQRS